jgi:hypothetical protein
VVANKIYRYSSGVVRETKIKVGDRVRNIPPCDLSCYIPLYPPLSQSAIYSPISPSFTVCYIFPYIPHPHAILSPVKEMCGGGIQFTSLHTYLLQRIYGAVESPFEKGESYEITERTA